MGKVLDRNKLVWCWVTGSKSRSGIRRPIYF